MHKKALVEYIKKMSEERLARLPFLTRMRYRFFGRPRQEIYEKLAAVRVNRNFTCEVGEYQTGSVWKIDYDRWYRAFGESVFELSENRTALLLLSRYTCGLRKSSAFEMYLYYFREPENANVMKQFFEQNDDIDVAGLACMFISHLYHHSGKIEFSQAIRQATCGEELFEKFADEIMEDPELYFRELFLDRNQFML